MIRLSISLYKEHIILYIILCKDDIAQKLVYEKLLLLRILINLYINFAIVRFMHIIMFVAIAIADNKHHRNVRST